MKSERDFSRRSWLKGVASMPLVSTLKAGESKLALPPVSVDAHTHFYDPERPGGIPWPTAGSPLYRRVFPQDWQRVAAPAGISHTIIIEASSRVEDNQWILDLAREDKSIVGYIGNLDPQHPHFRENLDRFSDYPLWKGVRVNEKSLKEHSSDPRYLENLNYLASKGQRLEVNGSYRFLKPLLEVCQAVPNLVVMVNHLGGPGKADSLAPEWREGIAAFKELPHVYCKVSALTSQSATEWGHTRADLEYYLPLLNHVWNHFGEDRLVFGSDWPVSDRGLNYEDSLRMILQFIQKKENASRVVEKMFHSNSQRFYKWTLRS